MTNLLFHHENYIKKFSATIVDINLADNAIALDKSAFFYGGGGQPRDTGILIEGLKY